MIDLSRPPPAAVVSTDPSPDGSASGELRKGPACVRRVQASGGTAAVARHQRSFPEERGGFRGEMVQTANLAPLSARKEKVTKRTKQ